MRRWFNIELLTAGFALVQTTTFAADEWQIIKVSGHDYLSVDNVSRFYGLPAGVAAGADKSQLDAVKNPLEFVSGSREAVINGARSWLCFPLIEYDGKYLVSRTDVAKTIEPLVRPHRVPNVGKVDTVVLDPGHGGHDKGQVSRYGPEKEFALDVARKLRPLLQAKGLRVIMTREGDYFVPLEVRAKIANAARNSIFVSIHFNATNDNPNATGFEIFSFTPRGAPSTSDSAVALSSFNMQPGSEVDAQSMALSACIYHSVLGHIPEYDRGIKRARFAVLRLTKVPAVLIEGGFLTERGESRLISNRDWRGKLAAAIGVGIESYRALGVKKQPPMLVADYRKQTKSVPTEHVIQEGEVKEADLSLMELVGKSKFLPPQQTVTPSKRSSLESAPIVP
ncbi:MAG TPA: N-acetylmuramoyl-L-alanine amidase [Candidatus Limnocylindria bacterium]|nr:N-acetylmuramoyl-L-alanine amidase [Candidatus Limnocylindria bacterium]